MTIKQAELESILEEVGAAFGAVIEEVMPGVDAMEIVWSSKTVEFFGGEVELFGVVLLAVHEYFQIPIQYDQYTEFDHFEDLNDAITYIIDGVLVKKGYKLDEIK